GPFRRPPRRVALLRQLREADRSLATRGRRGGGRARGHHPGPGSERVGAEVGRPARAFGSSHRADRGLLPLPMDPAGGFLRSRARSLLSTPDREAYPASSGIRSTEWGLENEDDMHTRNLSLALVSLVAILDAGTATAQAGKYP